MTTKGTGKGNGKSGFPSGMTTKRTGNGNGKSGFPSGMTTKRERQQQWGVRAFISVGKTERLFAGVYWR
jgi:hypothetical protein